ncbi:I/LWEQ domain-domain-containing protein [Catenaria anguillulae PL171]|uniref:I/LWEQ domain-domain-containing protein n=1 Tax=Catenaria anguillulae PL171 TaxID=765915 RepID=A0A1Y2HHB2_9FUNG|nr:I/LWEQ domain-domain-containing protein [Catenaria anguillulae PL171]
MPDTERSLVVGLLDQSLALLSTVQTAPRDKTSLADAVKALNGSVVKLLEGAAQVAATRKEAAPLPGPTATASAPVPVQAAVSKDSTREAVVGASSAMVTAISQLVTAKSVSGDIKKATGDLESAFRQLVSASKLVIPQANAHAKAEILELVQAASVQCVELIGSAKQQASVQAASPSREALSNAASSLGASVNKLMEKCAVVGSLGDVEVIRAMQALEMAAARLASPMLPTKIGDLTFSECLGKVVDDSRQIAQLMSTALKSPSTSGSSPSASVVSGVSNSASAVSPTTAPIDPVVLTQLCQVVASIADTAMFAAAILSPLPITSLQPLSTDMNRDLTLLESATTQQAVLDAASGVGVATNGMCSLIKTRASSLSVSEQERAELVEMATSLASASQHLIHAVKSYAVNMGAETKAAMVPHIPPVRSASDKVYAFSTEAAGPIRAAARKVVESGRNIVLTSDRARVVQHATALGHHLSGLVTSLRDVAPGQRELAAAIDQVQTAIAGVDEQLLASAVEGTKVTLCSNSALIEDCQALNRIVFGWTTESARIERDPARPVHAADAYTKITQSMTDSAMLELVKSIGSGLLRVMDNLKFSRPADALPAVEVGEDLVAILELRNQMHERVMAPLNNSDSAELNTPDALQGVQNAAKDLVALISKCKTPAGLRTGQYAAQLVAVFDRLCQVAKSCEEQTNDVVIRDRLHGSLERLGAAVVGVLLDRSKVSQLSSAIQALVATVQESVRASAQCLVAQQSITASLLPSLRETITKVEAGESIQVGPVAPGALQLRCNQLLESLNALVAAAESNMDTSLGDAAEGSIVILKQLVDDSRKHAAAQQSADSLKTVDEILGSWSTLVQVTSRAVTKPPSDPIFDTVRELANKISRLTTALTSNESQQEFQKLASVLEAAIKALPTYENELRGQSNDSEGAGAPPAGSTKTAEEWEQVRNVKETRAVALTTFDLIKSAAVCQREVSIRSAQTPTPTSPTSGAKYMDDGTWSDGLVSAAKQVAQAMQELIATATPTGDATQPAASRERLIACAKAVASATVQVVAAASVKSESNAPSLVKLKASAKTVVQTAETMVNKIKTSNVVDKGLGDELLALKPSNQTSARLALLEAQTSVLTMEAELERARARLTNIKKARYSGQPDAPAP